MASLFSAPPGQDKFDPKLTSLFSSRTKLKPPKQSQKVNPREQIATVSASDADEDESSESSSSSDEDEDAASSDSAANESSNSASSSEASAEKTIDPPFIESLPDENIVHESRSKKRKYENEDLEGKHLQKLVEEEARENDRNRVERSVKKQKHSQTQATGSTDNSSEDDENQEAFPITHETLADSKEDSELEKASRTIFLANVSIAAMTSKPDLKVLKTHLVSFEDSENKPKIESLRFRSTAYASSLPKKAAFARKDLMDATTKSTNAYVVYSTQRAAREAAKHLNGTVVLGRHIRVDQIAHPAQIDHRRCVFVGNLGFVDDPSQINESPAGEITKKKKKSQQGDVEEGLWQQFSKAGPVESVRVPRDPKTRVGKGFAYVQFKDENSVEGALLFNDKKFPPLLPRSIRVVRAKKVRRDGSTGSKRTEASTKPRYKGTNRGKIESEQTLRGRVKKLLGKAGASQAYNSKDSAIKPPESFVFEGHRASSKQGNSGLKLTKAGKKNGKNGRLKRAATWKAKKKS